MDKIKKWYRSIPIWLALFLFVVVALLFASVCSARITQTVTTLSTELQAKYMTFTSYDDVDDPDVSYKLNDQDTIVQYNFNYDKYSEADRHLHHLYRFTLRFTPIFFYSAFLIAAILLFYFTKVKRPLSLLTLVSDKIAENELSFQVEYPGTDEMARLCAAFEKMRFSLDENNKHMLHMIDQRKQLNDAYTHDLRTPIAVLKGYTDMLAKYIPNGKMSETEVLETISTMSSQVARLEQFVESMNAVQKLEDLAIQKIEVNTTEFIGHLEETAEILCQSNGLACMFTARLNADNLYLDAAAVIQVYENLMSNAVRFAKKNVTVECGYTAPFIILTVSDDGNGFSEKDLLKASQPYYSGETSKQNYHFGIGLYICKTLCEKHGGMLKLANKASRGAEVKAYFNISE